MRRRVAALALEVVASKVRDTGPSEWVRLDALGLLFSGLAGQSKLDDHKCGTDESGRIPVEFARAGD